MDYKDANEFLKDVGSICAAWEDGLITDEEALNKIIYSSAVFLGMAKEEQGD